MRIWLLFLLTILFSGHTLRAQLPKLWDKSYGGSSGDVLHTILPLTNGNLVIGGYSDSDDNGSKTVGNYGDYDYYIVCTDSSGNQLWDAGFGGNDDDVFAEVIQTTDGGFLLGGHSYSGNSGTKSQGSQGQEDYWVVKTSASGTEEWDKRFGGTASDYLTSVCATSDGGYLLGGYSESGANGDKSQSSWGDNDFWVVKIDGNGTKIWDKRFGGTDDDYCRFVYQTTDGGYLLAGYSNSSSNGDKSQSSWGGYDYWVVKIDGDGVKEWDKRFGTTSSDYGMGAAPDGSDGVVVGGYTTGGISGDKTQTNYGDEDFWLIRVDATGTKVWDKRFGGNDTEHDFGNVFRTSDGGYLATGNSYSPVSGSKSQSNLGLEQTWMLKCDANGSLVGDQTLLTNGHEEIGFTAATQNGCILLGNKSSASTGGDKTQSTHGSYDYFIAKYCLTDKPVANFSVPDTTICQTQCITFNDGSYNYPSAWSWSFPGGFPATSTQQNPQVCYNYNGIYDVTLIVTNWTGSDTILLPGYINVSALVANPVITQNGT
ncbi:MAG TPA: PKD domain-containing protein, partial [Chitinophagales bacterium]|nr:PKD domain-containing protein [Chitinophagales bacterium]